MIKIVKTKVRPSIDVPFYEDINDSTEEYKMYLYKNYIKKKKLLNVKKSLSEDGLTHVTVMEWENLDDFLDFCTDDFCINEHTNLIAQYEIRNQIESDISIDQSE